MGVRFLQGFVSLHPVNAKQTRRLYSYGYRSHEVLPRLTDDVDPTFSVIQAELTTATSRNPMAASLGTHYVGGACPLPDITHVPSAVFGVTKRIACKMPDVDMDLYHEFLLFVVKIFVEQFSHCILNPSDDISVESWLRDAPYTNKRKAMLQDISEKRSECKPGDLFVMCHVKHEPYIVYKHFRGIYSRSDFFKTQIGPVCSLIGKKMFTHPSFIKTVPVADRPEFLINRYSVPGAKMAANDFTSFESMFKPLQMVVELLFFFFCTQFLDKSGYWNKMMLKIKMGKNKLVFKRWMAWLTAKRYSGEMDTSSMNGLFNLLLILFMNFKSGETHTIPPTVEGDDSLNLFFGKLDHTILIRLGAKAKLEYFDDVFSASFCGMVFSSETPQIITDPIKALLTFGYSNNFYLKSSDYKLKVLLRSKSLSMLHTFPGCPVLNKLAAYGLRVTSEVSNRDVHSYVMNIPDGFNREKLLESISSKSIFQSPTHQTRLLMEEKFGLDTGCQVEIERYLDSLVELQPLSHPLIDDLLSQDQLHYYENYCHSTPISDYNFL